MPDPTPTGPNPTDFPDFWPNCGFRLLDRDEDGRLRVTDDFLRIYLGRPELAPEDESCDAERALHARLTDSPRDAVADDEIAAVADADARENYQVLIAFRDHLLQAGTVEGCYMGLFLEGDVTVPGLFVDHMAQVIVRNVLDGVGDPFRVRAAEMFFRQQNATVEEGAILLGDSESVETLATTGGMGSLGKLVLESGAEAKQIGLDVLQPETADVYWGRNERFDMVIDLTFARPGLDALCRVLEAWVAHFTGAKVNIQPVQQISDEKWVWHVGLDREASALLNDLYEGADIDEGRMERLLSLFRLEFENASLMRPDIAGRPVYLGLAMTADKKVRLKPQNLLVNLPLAPES